MTVPTAEAAPTEGSAPAPRQRPVRRALDDLGLIVTAEHVERIAADEPAWLADDRRAAFDAFEALPAESNLLYTTYIDLRAAQLADAALATDGPATAPTPIELPDGQPTACSSSSRAATSRSRCPTRRAAGVGVDRRRPRSHADPDAVRDAARRRADALPADDKFAQLTRALWTQGVLLDVPAGVHLDRPDRPPLGARRGRTGRC